MIPFAATSIESKAKTSLIEADASKHVPHSGNSFGSELPLSFRTACLVLLNSLSALAPLLMQVEADSPLLEDMAKEGVIAVVSCKRGE